MEFSELFSFLIILKESTKLVPRNGKLMASIALLSLILPSILVLSFSHVYQSLTDYVNPSTGPDSGSYPTIQTMLIYLTLLVLVEIVFLLVFFMIFHVSGIATIIVSSASYTGDNLSSKDLLSCIRRTWRKPFSASFHFSGDSSTRYPTVIIILAVFLWFIMYPNIFTIFIAIIIGIAVVVFQLYSSVVRALSLVITVLEESSSAEALEKAGNLLKGHHLKGFMLNLFTNLLFSIVLALVYILSDKGSMDMTVYGLCFVSVLSILKMVLVMGYTVLYFQCKKEHGEERVVYGNVEYTKLSNTAVDDDIA